MNIIDLIIITIIAWQGIWGYLKGGKFALCGLIGVFFSFGITAMVHSYLASGLLPVISEALSFGLESERVDLNVDITAVEKLGLSEEVIDYWFVKEDYQEVIGMTEFEYISEVDIFLFLLANLVSFLIFFWLLKYFSNTLADIMFRKDYWNKNLTAASNLGLFIGVLQGFLICALYVFLLVLMSSLNFPYAFLAELHNSKLAVIMLDLTSSIWNTMAVGG